MRIILAGILVMLACSIATGQRLTRMLTVEIGGTVYGSYIDWSRTFGGPGGSGMVELTQIKTWKGFCGGLPVSESEFYRIAGYELQSVRAAEYRTGSIGMFWGGLILALGGCGAMLSGGLEEPENTPLMIVGGIGFTVGFVLELGGAMRLGTQLTPASFALQVADEYNRKLENPQ